MNYSVERKKKKKQKLNKSPANEKQIPFVVPSTRGDNKRRQQQQKSEQCRLSYDNKKKEVYKST